MQPEFWGDKRPAGVPGSLDFATCRFVVEVFERSCKKFTDRPAFSNLGVALSYAELDRLSAAFAACLQKQTDLQPGDCITVQTPNVLQCPITVFGALRAGLVVVNTNPLYTAREMCHQFKDAGMRALVYLNVFGKLVKGVLPDTRTEHLIEARMGGLLSTLKSWPVNSMVKSVKKMVPDYRLPQALPFRQALKQDQGHALQPVRVGLENIAMLQYTGGTTGVSRGAILTHGNLVVNMLQVHAQFSQLDKDSLPLMKEAQEMTITSLSFCHVYASTVNYMCMMVSGNHNVLITNPRDISGFIKELKKWRSSALFGLSILFAALMEHPGSKDVGSSNLRLANSGDATLVSATTERWKGVTGCAMAEGYGLTECSSVVTTNPYGEQARLGAAEIPVVGMALKVIDEQSSGLPVSERGELCMKDPQVMRGYWQRSEATEEILDVEDWLKTGGIAMIDEDGFVRIAGRKKDLISVSGSDTYPGEIEDVMMTHSKVASYAAVGTLDERPGEAMELFMVARDPNLSVKELKACCKENLIRYKIPRQIVLKDALPVTPVGEVLRRELHEVARQPYKALKRALAGGRKDHDRN